MTSKFGHRLSLMVCALLTSALALTHSGCSGDPPTRPSGPPPTEFGVVTGKVHFPEEPPQLPNLTGTCCDPDKPLTLPDETVVVNPNKTLKDVIVFVRGAVPVPRENMPVARISQVDCRYVPHVMAIRTGQTLEIENGDSCWHNVHVKSRNNPAMNLWQKKQGQVDTVVYRQPEKLQFKCDIHPWMLAHVRVFEHDYFAVTGEDGTFRIENAPAGRYWLVAWHARYGELRQVVEIPANGQLSVDFTYKKPAK